jgi:aryl sulfotransferase
MTDGSEARLANDFPAERYFEIERSYWAARKQPNLLMVHYNDMLADLDGEMRRIAQFLAVHIPAEQWPALVNAASFHFMREHGATLMPRAAQGWDKGAERFLHAGTNGRWRDVLSADDIALYDARVRRELSPNLARWLEQGSRLAGDPRQMAD